ncbi:extracellular solute-binding protein [Sphingomonas sp.]|uniref:extracellular solute-binding protein n=1 Tax=Sphingomonas sp. TaxID=28214 RepID=UPI00286E4988|nr:extracellular solute-binding protein [Sphingomonas sp.]
MKRLALALAALVALGSCAPESDRTEIYLQRFWGECGALYGKTIDVSKAEGECGIITALINKFNAENRDIHVESNVVAWPGYAQLSAQIAANDPPDLVTVHQGVLTDYATRGLVEPLEPMLREAGIDPAAFTEAARRGVTKNGAIYGLPWDTIGGLFHINTKLFAKAGLMRGGKPVLPNSPQELLAHARQFKQRTGLPYLIQSQVNDPATHVRNLYTFLLAQDAAFFPDTRHIRIDTPQAREIVGLLRQINVEQLGTRNQDTPAAINSFLNGQGGIYPTGTWMIGAFDQEANTPGRPLHKSYAVFPYPRLWGRPAAFVDGHSWAIPKGDRSPQQRRAIARLLKFFAEHNFDWARTGHIPAFSAVLDSAEFKALPHRADIAPLGTIGRTLPGAVERQGAIEGIVGEELQAAVTGQKPVDRALADAERRSNDLMSKLD